MAEKNDEMTKYAIMAETLIFDEILQNSTVSYEMFEGSRSIYRLLFTTVHINETANRKFRFHSLLRMLSYSSCITNLCLVDICDEAGTAVTLGLFDKENVANSTMLLIT